MKAQIARIGHRALGEDLAKVAVNIFYAVLLWYFGKIVNPLDASGAVQLLPRLSSAVPPPAQR